MFLLGIFSFISLILFSESANVLGIFSVPSISHQIVFRPLMHELARRGHNVTMITTDPVFENRQGLQNLKEINVREISYSIWNDIKKNLKNDNFLKEIKQIKETMVSITEAQMKSVEVQNFIKNGTKEIDLIIWEVASKAALGYASIYDVPVIGISSFGGYLDIYDMMGASDHPILNPHVLCRRIFNLSIFEMIHELYNHFSSKNFYKNLETAQFELVHTIFGPEVPTMKNLKNNIQKIFLNTHVIWDFNRPVPLSVSYLSYLHEKPPQGLQKDLKEFLDSSHYGVIYISFGTNSDPSIFSNKTLEIFTKVFSQLHYDILMKWDTDEIPGRPENLKILKWFPQSDLLRHPKVKLFITQGGLQSTEEAIAAGIPVVGIPLFVDQWFNTEQYVYHKIGVQLDLLALTESILMNAIQSVISNESYKQNIIKLQSILQDQPHSSLERAVLWTEYVLKNGKTALLRAPASDMHWIEYYEVELISYVLLFLVFIFLFLTYLVKSMLKFIGKEAKIKNC